MELRGRLPNEAHLKAVGDAAGVRPDPGFMRSEDDPDAARVFVGFGARRSAISKAPAMAGYKRAAVPEPRADWL